jgi:hypothetical protein
MEKKIRSELMKMTAIMVVLLGLGVYAHEFVIAGIKAKAALNLSIFATFGLAAWLAFRHVFKLQNEVIALNALKVDYGVRSRRPLDPYKQPAVVFNEPELLGQGYRMITEELGKQDSLHLSNSTVQLLLHDVDQRINDRKSTIMYFSGLMVFLGLLGAFMGLMKTVHSVGDLIGSMDVSGAGGSDSFGKLIEGMKGPLNGMSVGFSSSLFGLMTSMVLGALERFMTSAMKTLRNEFEHWLSNIAELEGNTEQAAAANNKAELAGVVKALVQGSRQLDDMRRVIEEDARAGDETHRAVAAMAAQVENLGLHVGKMADPAPVLNPLVATVSELARSQAAILTRVEAMFQTAERDRLAMVAMMESMVDQTARYRPLDSAAIHAQFERLIALQSEIAEKGPVIVGVPVEAAGPPATVGGWRARLAAMLHWRRDRVEAALRKDVRTLASQQEKLAQDVKASFDGTVGWLATQREADRALLRRLADEQATADDRLARLIDRLEGQEQPHGARAEIEMLSRGLGANVEESATPPETPKANPMPHRAAGNE